MLRKKNQTTKKKKEKQNYLEEVITSHARFTRHTSRDDNSMCALEGFVHGLLAVACNSRTGVDVREICGDSGGVDDVVKSEVGDEF